MINNENIEYLTSVRVDLLEGDIGGEKGEVAGGGWAKVCVKRQPISAAPSTRCEQSSMSASLVWLHNLE